jgi:hypothetical protein
MKRAGGLVKVGEDFEDRSNSSCEKVGASLTRPGAKISTVRPWRKRARVSLCNLASAKLAPEEMIEISIDCDI